MTNYSKQIFFLIFCVVVFVVNGCDRSQESAKTSTESTEFFKEIGSVEQENTEMITGMETQPAVIPPAASEQIVMSSDVPTPEKPSIQDIQLALKNANVYQGKVDGVLGPKTKHAIEEFQSQNALKSDGKVGPMTWAKLRTYWNSSSSSPAATASVSTIEALPESESSLRAND